MALVTYYWSLSSNGSSSLQGQLVGDLSLWKQQLELAIIKFRTT